MSEARTPMPSQAKPNILLITTDQQRTDTLGCYGASWAHTPHLDQLSTEGVRLERAYCTNPVCTPARISLLTGQQVSRHGAWNVGVHAPHDLLTLGDRLGQRGYRTHSVGKLHLQPTHDPESLEHHHDRADMEHPFAGPYYGFQSIEQATGHGTWGLCGHYGQWVRRHTDPDALARKFDPVRHCEQPFGGEAVEWNLPTRLHNSVWTADRSIAFLEDQADTGQPFFLAVGFQDPHHPHILPRDLENRVAPGQVSAPDFVPGELTDKPPHFQAAHEGRLEPWQGEYSIAGQSGKPVRDLSEKDQRLGRAYYHSMVRLIDREVGRILHCLEENHLAENTLVVFTSDHGELLGDHGLWLKGPFHYEQLVRVPMILRWPAGLPAGAVRNALFSHADLVPTLLAALGLPLDDEPDGVDAAPVLRGEQGRVRDAALIECVDDPAGLRAKTLVTEDRKLTWYAGHSFGELYDLREDPRERRNLWDDSAYATEKAALLGRLIDTLEPTERARRAPRTCYA